MWKATKVYLLRPGGILLAQKRGGQWDGYWDGYGGKHNSGESAEACAIRETRQESGIVIERRDLLKVAVVTTHFAGEPSFELAVFTTLRWCGTPKSSREAGEPQWFDHGWLPLKMR